MRTSVGGVLEDGAVAVGAGRDDTDVVRVLDSSNDTGSENELLPGLANVDDVDAYVASLGIAQSFVRAYAPSDLLFQT